MKIMKYLILLCTPLFFIDCSSPKLTSRLVFGASLIGIWHRNSDYTFKTTDGSGILVAFAMTRDGVEDSTVVYYGSFSFNIF